MATPTTLPATFTAGQVLTAAEMNNLRGAFRILQVVSTTKIDTFTTTSTTLTDLTGLSVSITPSATTSKVLVFASVTGISTNNPDGGSSGYVIVRGSTIIAQNTSLTQDLTGQLSNRFIGSGAFTVNHAITFLDSPATTSATTYKIQVQTAGTNTLYINRDIDNGVGSVSSLTVFEVSA